MQSNVWAGSKNLDKHKTFLDLIRAYSPNTYTVPMSIPLLSKANRGFRAVSSTITDTYLSIGDSFSDSVFRDLKRSSVKP